MKFPAIFALPPRDIPGDEGGGAQAASPGGGIAPPPPGQAGGDAPWAMPEGLPARLTAGNEKEFGAKLLDDWRAQHRTLSSLPPPPKSVDEFSFEPSDKLKPFLGDLAGDPVLKAAREAALDAGVPAAAFSKMFGGVYERLADAGLLVKPLDAAAEARALLGRDGDGLEPQAALAKIAPRFEAAQRAVDALATQAGLPAESKAALYALFDTAHGFRALEAVAGALTKLAGGPQPGGESGGARGTTREQLLARTKDPRNDRNLAVYDPAFATETDRLYREFRG